MKTIGLLGGMSWESTIPYYQTINTVVKAKLGGYHSARCILYSVDFQEIETCQSIGDWETSAKILSAAALKLQAAGADFLILCTNTMHKVADTIESCLTIPLLHIADLTIEELQKQNYHQVALLGTKYTMEQDFYKRRLIDQGLEVMVPDADERNFINDTIYQELCLGTISPVSKRHFLDIVDTLAEQGAQAVILGCTEIGLLFTQADTSVPLFDTTLIHAQKAAEYALKEL